MSGLDTSKNSIICHSCANDVTGEYVACQGFCNAVFHPQCCGTPLDLVKEIISHRHAFWLCLSCSNLMSDLRHRRSVQCAFEAGQELSLSHHNRIVEQLKTEILSELKTELKLNFDKLISSNSLTPRSASRGTGGLLNNGSRRLFGNNLKPVPEKDPRVTQDVADKKSTPNGGFVAGNEDARFWLYLSKVSRRVTVDQITKLATDRLGVTDIKVTRLVAKGRDVSRMSFISFRVGMNMNLKERALSPSTWPDGLVVREFEDRSSGNFWEPSSDVNPAPPSDPKGQKSATHSPPSTTTPPPSTTPLTSTTPLPNPTLLPISTPMSKNPDSPMSTASAQSGSLSA